MIRYGFNIRTKHGQRVENILIMAATQIDAERRLRQMYHHCEIVECHEHAIPRRVDTLDVEGVIGLISELESACDSFVSLHRAEGFGFALAECMYLGKPVIATDWSATAEFINATNGCPVRAGRCPVPLRGSPPVSHSPGCA